MHARPRRVCGQGPFKFLKLPALEVWPLESGEPQWGWGLSCSLLITHSGPPHPPAEVEGPVFFPWTAF